MLLSFLLREKSNRQELLADRKPGARTRVAHDQKRSGNAAGRHRPLKQESVVDVQERSRVEIFGLEQEQRQRVSLLRGKKDDERKLFTDYKPCACP